jgi:hypothetical protein
MTIRTTGQFDATAGLPLAGSVFDELAALASLQMSFEPNPALGATITSARSSRSSPPSPSRQLSVAEQPASARAMWRQHQRPSGCRLRRDRRLSAIYAADRSDGGPYVGHRCSTSTASRPMKSCLRGGASSGNEEYIFPRPPASRPMRSATAQSIARRLPGYNLLDLRIQRRRHAQDVGERYLSGERVGRK